MEGLMKRYRAEKELYPLVAAIGIGCLFAVSWGLFS